MHKPAGILQLRATTLSDLTRKKKKKKSASQVVVGHIWLLIIMYKVSQIMNGTDKKKKISLGLG